MRNENKCDFIHGPFKLGLLFWVKKTRIQNWFIITRTKINTFVEFEFTITVGRLSTLRSLKLHKHKNRVQRFKNDCRI